MQEIWKDIKGYEGLYQVSNLGRVKSLKRKRWNRFQYIVQEEHIMKQEIAKGYYRVHLSKNNVKERKLVHILVAQAFIKKEDYKLMPIEKRNNISYKDLQVNHKDENKLNNNINNLEWCTKKYNRNYGTATERVIEKRNKPILQYSKNGDSIKEWKSIKEASVKLNITYTNIICCCIKKYKRKTAGGYIWKYKEGND